jgi:hypothetical protein
MLVHGITGNVLSSTVRPRTITDLCDTGNDGTPPEADGTGGKIPFSWNRIKSSHMRFLIPLVLLCIVAVVAPPASAHAPLGAGENHDLATATLVPDPLKSFVVYGHLHEPGEAAYFRMEMARGDRLVLAVNVNGAAAPVPDLVVMGPGIPPSGTVPLSPEIPPGSGVRVIPGAPPAKAEYEPFSPSVIYEVASYTMSIEEPGTYYAAVLSQAGETDYSFVVGYREQFTAAEWLLIPFSLIGIYIWEGQPAWAVAAPYALVILLCLGILAWQERRAGTKREIRAWAASLGGILCLGTGASTIYQMLRALSLTGYAPESTITLAFALIPILLGAGALRLGRPGLPATLGRRLSLVVVGVLGLVAWAGLMMGPVLALVAAVLPKGSPGEGTD